jgi:hypothetical protein
MSVPFASSVITPSFPFGGVNSPMISSLLAEIEAICLILSESDQLLLLSWVSNNSFNNFVNSSFKSIGLAPAATFQTFFTIACAKTVAVVVPSPAKSFVLKLLL